MEVAEAVKLCLSKWTALDLALNLHNTRMPEDLPGHLTDLILNYQVQEADVQEFLEEYMDDHFAVDIEDGSAADIAEILMNVFRESRQNRSDTLERLRSLQHRPVQPIEDSSEEDSGEDSGEDSREDSPEDNKDPNHEAMDLDEEPPPLVPDTDEEGFTVVKSRKKR